LGASPVLQRELPNEFGKGFEDNGCRVYPKCLQCPLPRCVLTLQEDVPTMTRDELRDQFQMMRMLGVTVAAIRSITHLTDREIESMSR